jgi:glycogen debranching enzyme
VNQFLYYQTKSGKITAQNKTGKTTITITLASGKKRTLNVTVQSGDVKTTKITGVAKTISLEKNKKVTLK